MPGSAAEPKPAFQAPHKEGPVGIQPPSAPDPLLAAKSVPTSPSPSAGPAGKQSPSAVDHAAERTANRATDSMSSPVQGSRAAHSTVRQVVEPLLHEALPNLAAASRNVVHEAFVQTHKTVSETVASALHTLESWTAGWLPSGKAAQGYSEGTAPEPLVPLVPSMPPPLGDNPFLSLPGTMQVGSGAGLGLVLLGVLATALILRRRDGPLTWISYEPPKPTSALLVALERPG
jgi:hypothetical protein